ncbi:hypothetical protein ACFYNO_12780 [Kitasatospora sp. NPDC006697]|uniref:hypothetical protein n=1 Tax=Kitasatospora sp. NPDC006697 TaxID=3364020 RepID=UPI00369B02FC
MTTQGDPQAISDGATPSPEVVRSGGGNGSRRALAWCGALAVLGAGSWLVSRPHPGDLLPGLGSTSRDKSVVLGNPAPTSATNPNPFDANLYFPAAKPAEVNAYHGRRTSGRQGQDCTEIEADPALLKDAACQGYLALSFTRADGRVLSSVTVLRFADAATATQVAGLLKAQGGAVTRFVLPDATVAAPTPAAGGKSTDPAPRVEPVAHYVTVTTSRFADGHPPAAPVDPDLDEATRACAFTADAAFMWTSAN